MYRTLKRIVCAALMFALTAVYAINGVAAGETYRNAAAKPGQDLSLSSEIVFLVDSQTGAVLFGQNQQKTFNPVGGLVHLMTAYIASMELSLEEQVTIGAQVDELPRDVRTIGLHRADQCTVEDLIASLLLYGAQDAAIALAVQVAGSPEAFVARMNQMAAELGMNNTVYLNCTGGYQNDQVTTAQDAMRLAMEVHKNSELFSIITLTSYSFKLIGDGERFNVQNRNEVVKGDQTGLTWAVSGASSQVGANAVGLSDRNNVDALILLAGASSQSALDSESLYLAAYADASFGYADITEAVQKLILGLKIESNQEFSQAAIQPAQQDTYLVCAYTNGFDQEQLYLAALEDTLIRKEDGGYTMTAALLYADEELFQIPLTVQIMDAQPVPAPTPGPALAPAEQEPTDGIIYYDPEDYARDDAYLSFAWIKWVILGAVLSFLAIAVGRFIYKRTF